jgi:hypothetical protein
MVKFPEFLGSPTYSCVELIIWLCQGHNEINSVKLIALDGREWLATLFG